MTAFSRLARSFIRNYLFQQSRVGRSTCKKILKPFLQPNQRIEIEPGLVLDLDLTKSNQEFIFWFYEELESSLQWAIQTLLPTGGVFVDCGANIGLMGLLAIHHRTSHVVFVEPHPRLVETIRNTLRLNKLEPYATVWECAASNKEGVFPLYLDSKSDGGHSLLNQNSYHCETTVSVKTRRLDTLFHEKLVSHIHFLKVDTEGYDFQALEGLGSFLDPQYIDLIYVEMCGDYQGIWNLMLERGYRPFASEMIYIDELRRLKRKKDMSRFYVPVEQPGDGNLLWCVKDSINEKFLMRTHDNESSAFL